MDKRNAAWTVMVYLAGDNNLTTECLFALTEMKQAEIGKRVNVIAQFDPYDPHLPTHRYEIQRRGKKTSFRHEKFGSSSIGNPEIALVAVFSGSLLLVSIFVFRRSRRAMGNE